MTTTFNVAVIVLVAFGSLPPTFADNVDLNQVVRSTAERFGNHFDGLGNERTCFDKINKNYQQLHSSIVQIDVTQMMEDMRTNLTSMLAWKKEAVEKIAHESERIAAEYVLDSNLDNGQFYNMKSFANDKLFDNRNYSSIPISPHRNFHESLVNLDNSAVHIPINVYEKAPDIFNDILWSENLTQVFIENYRRDQSLSWQFFGSSKGFTRIYPATNWRAADESYSHTKIPQPDLYDCRIREWYITAAASPKDVIILFDVSGSMTGVRKTIALNVVFNILETLTENDYVLVLRFSNEVREIHPCLKNPVLATRRNVREIRENVIENLKTYEVANFSLALIQSFQILQGMKEERKGALCNQAIMLITDGAPETYDHIFKEYNANATVRLFTYVIGRDITQIHEVHWMACHNRGYYAQVANLAEVREQVMQYVPIMSRPMVLSNTRASTWTPVYAHVSENLLTDWVWNERVKSLKTRVFKIKDTESENFENNQEELEVVVSPAAQQDQQGQGQGQQGQQQPGQQQPGQQQPGQQGPGQQQPGQQGQGQQGQSSEVYVDISKKWLSGFNLDNEVAKMPSRKKRIKLMITLATPVFDPRKFQNVTKKILVKNVYINSDPELIQVANLLGIAGVDVPIDELKKRAPQYYLGVNAYSFVMTNNAKLIYHPDHRPLFKDWLKPYYSSVDMNEVEIGERTHAPKEGNKDIEQIRTDMLNGKKGSKKVVIKTTIDSMKRPIFRSQHYIYGGVDNTPFSFAIVLPEPYGSYRVRDMLDIEDIGRSETLAPLFEGKSWRVHPEWVYCEMPRNRMPETAEDTILQFLNEDLPKNNYLWKSKSSSPPQLDKPFCDKSMLENLIFDARATRAAGNCVRGNYKNITVINTLVSGRSGLTRFVSHLSEKDFSEHNYTQDYQSLAGSIDEVYYRRAVDYHYVDSEAFVYSVPFYEKYAKVKYSELMVTASKAIVVKNGKLNVPMGVVGVHYNYTYFFNYFFKTAKENGLDCNQDNLDCYILDNNAFVLVSNEKEEPGKFFGDLNNNLLEDMVKVNIYKKIPFYDYQAICIEIKNVSSASSTIGSIMEYIRKLIMFLASRVVTSYVNLLYEQPWVMAESPEEMVDTDYENDMYEKRYNKSRPKPCHTEFHLFELSKLAEDRTYQHVYDCTENSNGCKRYYYVHKIRNSNLILLVVEERTTCNCSPSSAKLEPKEIIYNSRQHCEMFQNEAYRRRPGHCCDYHDQEGNIKQCGKAAHLQVSLVLMFVSLGLHYGLLSLLF